MERRDRVLLALGAAAAVAAAGLAILLGPGTVDAPAPPPDAPGTGTGGTPAPRRRALPALRIPPDLPESASAALRAAWETVASGTGAEAREALRSLAPGGRDHPLEACAPRALEALAPALEAIIVDADDALAAPAMGTAVALARAGGKPGREALRRSGLVERAFAVQAGAAPPALREETARLLGIAGGEAAVEWLGILLAKGESPEVRAAAAAAVADAHVADGGLPREAIDAVREAAARPGAPAVVSRSCIRTFSRAFDAFRPYGVGGLVEAALADADPALRLDAARFFADHPMDAHAGALVRALGDPDPRIVEPVADALAEIRPPEAREPLERLQGTLRDPAALRSVERALKALGSPR